MTRVTEPALTVSQKIEGLRDHIRWAERYAQKDPSEYVFMCAFIASCRARIIDLRAGKP